MAARTGMVDLVRELRGMANVSTNQYSTVTEAGTVTWWSDAQLMEKLDSRFVRTDLNNVMLQPVAETGSGGTALYVQYYAPMGNLEQNTSGTVYFEIEDGVGSVIGTANYSVDYVHGLIRFNADQGGSARYLRARSYNLAAAAAAVWRSKASHYSDEFTFQSDNQKFDKLGRAKNALFMAEFWDAKAGISTGIRSVQMVRTDLLPKGKDWS